MHPEGLKQLQVNHAVVVILIGHPCERKAKTRGQECITKEHVQQKYTYALSNPESHTHARARANSFQFCRRLELLRSADRQANLACVAPGARRTGRRRFEVLATKPEKATSTQSCFFLNAELQAMLDDEFSIAMDLDGFSKFSLWSN